jgi:heme A synthase
VAAVHIVFGAIVRISGSGMGCQDAWPKCRHPDGNTYWFPPLDHPQIVIEWTHRLLATLLLVALAALAAVAWRHRHRGPAVLAQAATALGLGVTAAVFGAVTVFLENPAWATAVHKLIAAGCSPRCSPPASAPARSAARASPRSSPPGPRPAPRRRAGPSSARGSRSARSSWAR